MIAALPCSGRRAKQARTRRKVGGSTRALGAAGAARHASAYMGAELDSLVCPLQSCHASGTSVSACLSETPAGVDTSCRVLLLERFTIWGGL